MSAPTAQELRDHLLPLLTAADWTPATEAWVFVQRGDQVLSVADRWLCVDERNTDRRSIVQVDARVTSVEQAVAYLRVAGALPAEELVYEPAVMHGGHSAAWIHGCGHLEAWPTDPKYPPIEGEGCDACESAPDGSWRQLHVRREAVADRG